MAELREQERRLLDLPEDIIKSIAIKLEPADKISFMAACKKTAELTLLTAGATLRITKDTKFVGIKQVLDRSTAPIQLEIIWTPDYDNKVLDTHIGQYSAMDVFMGLVPSSYLAEIASTSRWENINKVTIQGNKLKCLVPHFIAVSCPQLTQLKLVNPDYNPRDTFTDQAANVSPLTECSSLRHLQMDCKARHALRSLNVQLPPAHHTIADLCHNLPNIDTLVLEHPCGVLIDAFASQLTRLEIKQSEEMIEESIRKCSRLKHLSLRHCTLPYNTAPLNVLKIMTPGFDDDAIKEVIKVPSLNSLHLGGLRGLHEFHPCPWQELHLGELWDFTALGHLNLSILKKLSMGPDVSVILPDPTKPDSLSAVQRAADNLSRAVKMKWEGSSPKASVSFGECGTLTWRFVYHQGDHAAYEQTLATMVSMAAQHLPPVKICDCQFVVGSPLILREVFKWGHAFLESICLGMNYDLPSYVWEALTQFCRLNTIVLWDNGYFHNFDEGQAYEKVHIPNLVCNAAKYYVIPNKRNLRIELGTWCYCDRNEPILRDNQSWYCSRIPEMLPAGSKLDSFGLCPSRPAWIYNDSCSASAFWVAVVSNL